jgi:predicted kinase
LGTPPKKERKKMETPVLYVVMGAQASGKSTWIRENLSALDIVSPDLYGDLLPGERWWNNDDEPFYVTAAKAWAWAWQQFGFALQRGKDFIFEATLPTKIARSPLINVAKAFGYEVVCIYNVESLQTLLERNQARTPAVPPEAIARTYLAQEEPEFAEGWDSITIPNSNLEKDYVVKCQPK